ncbi:MAG TPA: potassium-transporting ATPase subunit KdpA, partial [Rhodanobacteraceae bacterium]|nr:potassium-transporting ATPase subunit KdpA [Rhodanobacteraceae bacterium]
MTINALVQIGLYLGLTLLAVRPLGAYMAAVFSETPNRMLRIGAPIERVLYRLGGVDASEDMSWRRYAVA